MKNRTIKVMITVLLTVLLVGCNSITVGEQQEIIEVNKIENTATDNSLNKWNNAEVYFIKDMADFNALIPILENRDGKIIIEVLEGTVIDSEENGVDSCGYYINNDTKRFSVGDRVQTVFIFNPNTNFIDEILYRVDSLI